jgi:WD40 repeat protein
MGQKAGKAAYADAARPFLNLSPTALAALWDSFNDVADGFGLSSREVQQICAILQDELQLPRCKLDEKASGLMDLLDVDCNGLVDAIEMMSALAVCSGLSPADTVAFIFNCYDFDGSGMHTVDEVALAVKSTAIGVCKLANEPLPTDAEVDNLSLIIFEGAAEGDSEVLSAEHAELARVSSTRLRDQILEQPELFSWINFFDEPAEPDMDPLLPLAHEVDYEAECRPPGGGLEEAEAQAYETFPFPPKSDLVKQERELPWKSAIKSLVPSEWGSRVPPGDAPKHHLHMRWVYGYSSITSKNNARYNADGEVIYAAGRVGVAYSLSEHRQTHFLGHTGDIRCLAMHPDGVLVATGEVAASAGAKASIAIWDSRTGELIRVIRGVHDGGVIQLAFSPDGRLLASVGLDAHHSLAVYDWEACPTGRLVATAAGTNARVFACCFAGTRGRSIVVCSEESATFWRLERGGIVGVRGIFGRKARQQPLLACVALVGGGNGDHVVTGCASGHIYLWRDRNCVAAVKAHRGSAGALAPCAGGGFVSGGIDMRVRMWTKRLEPGASFDLSAFGPHSGIRSVCTSADGSRLLVGLASSGLYEISSADGSDLRGGAIAGSHAAGRVMGLAVHPSEPCFVTVGDDGVVRVWDAKRRIALRMTQLDSPTRYVPCSR